MNTSHHIRTLLASGLVLIGVTAGACNVSSSDSSFKANTSKLVEEARKAISQLPQKATPAARGTKGPSSDLYAGRTGTGSMAAFMTSVITDVDAYWSGVFRKAGLPEPHVTYAWPEPGQSVAYACSSTGQSTDNTAAYCPSDDQIVVSVSMAQRIWGGQLTANRDDHSSRTAGDFSVAYAVAHEYAHSIQRELNLITDTNVQPYPVIATELHADCWAGVWANSAYYAGSLDAGDVEEGIDAAALVGDYDTTDTEHHHGTPAQRIEAFSAGYNNGVARNCDTFLAVTNS